MKTIILNLNDSSKENEMICHLVDFLKSGGYSLSCNFHCDEDVAIVHGIFTGQGNAPSDGEDNLECDQAKPEVIVCMVDGNSLEANNQTDIMNISTNQTENDTMNLPLCAILSLSTVDCIDSHFDENQECSVLKASNVARVGDHVVFDYCGLSFKYPAALSELMVCNVDPVVKETSINVSIKFENSDTIYCVMLCVCEKEDSTAEHIMFGKDLIEITTKK